MEKAENFANLITGNLKGDIAYQREQNDKLRVELADNEKEKDRLATEISLQEEVVQKHKREMDDLSEKLRLCEDDLADLQDKHAACVTDLRRVTEEAEELVRREKAGEADREGLRESLDKLTKERDELIFRMNDLTEKYEQYVQEMTREREDINRANKNHTKLLTVSLLFSHLLKRKNQRLGTAFENMKKMARYKEKLGRRVVELAKWQENYKQKLAGLAFRRWRHGELSWTQERRINETLLAKERDRKQRAMLFSQWQRNFRETANKRDTQSEAARRMVELKAYQQEKSVRRSFGRWLKFARLKARRDLLLKKLLLKSTRRNEQDAFLTWLAATKQKNEDRKAAELAESVAEEKFKRQMFARLRHNLYLQEDSKVAEAQVTLEAKHREKQRNRFLKACTILCMSMNRRKENAIKAEGFESLKYNTLVEKRDRVKAELNERELPEVISMENELREETEDHKSNRKRAVLKAALIVFRRKMRYYFERWQNVLPIYQENTIKMKRILNHWQQVKLAEGFHKWLMKAHKHKMTERHVELEGAQANIESLDEAIKELDRSLTQQQAHWKNYSLSKLKRIAHIIARRFMHNRILQWYAAASALKGTETGGKILAKLLRKHSLAEGLKKYREQVQALKKAAGNEHKVETIAGLRNRNLLKKAFTAMKTATKAAKMAKRQLKKMLRDHEKNKARRRLAIWRTKTHTVIRETERVHNEKLAEDNENTRKQIETGEKQKKKRCM